MSNSSVDRKHDHPGPNGLMVLTPTYQPANPSSIRPRDPKRELSAEIAGHTATFLANGGEITVCPSTYHTTPGTRFLEGTGRDYSVWDEHGGPKQTKSGVHYMGDGNYISCIADDGYEGGRDYE